MITDKWTSGQRKLNNATYEMDKNRSVQRCENNFKTWPAVLVIGI